MNPANPPPRGELEFIRRLRHLLASHAGGNRPADSAIPDVPFGDDMCALDASTPLLWTVDMVMDGVDFDSHIHDWGAIGRKAMAVSLSDCAAMATAPVSAVCAIALSNALSLENALELMRGAHELGLRYGCPIVGGDTNSWDAPTVVSITVAARCEPGLTPVRRDGGRPGDRIWLTGQVGGSILGRHMAFEPRIELALLIRRALDPRAMIDISDGLALDLGRILDASGCGAVLDERDLDAVIHPDATRIAGQDGRPAREHALYDGEDFELVVILPADVPQTTCAHLGLRPLGRLTSEPGLFLESTSGGRVPIPIRGWEHFR